MVAGMEKGSLLMAMTSPEYTHGSGQLRQGGEDHGRMARLGGQDAPCRFPEAGSVLADGHCLGLISWSTL